MQIASREPDGEGGERYAVLTWGSEKSFLVESTEECCHTAQDRTLRVNVCFTGTPFSAVSQ